MPLSEPPPVIRKAQLLHLLAYVLVVFASVASSALAVSQLTNELRITVNEEIRLGQIAACNRLNADRETQAQAWDRLAETIRNITNSYPPRMRQRPSYGYLLQAIKNNQETADELRTRIVDCSESCPFKKD